MNTAPMGLIQTVANVVGQAAKGSAELMFSTGPGSLAEAAKAARVEPICLIDSSVQFVPELKDIVDTLLSCFSGYYLQAVNMMTTVDGVTVAKKLDPLNPNRGFAMESLRVESHKIRLGLEDMKHMLPTKQNQDRLLRTSLEDREQDTLQNISQNSNLAVGKLFNVTISNSVNGKKSEYTIPVSIRLLTHNVPQRNMVSYLAKDDLMDTTMGSRYQGWLSGRLTGLKDLILCRDLVAKRVKKSMNDQQGVLRMINDRQTGNAVAALATGKGSIATASNLAIISTDTLSDIENAIGGRFSNSRVRETVFDSTNLLILCVVDKLTEHVTFWHRGLDSPSTNSFRDLKMQSKGGGADVTDILKAYMAGSAPAL